MKYEFMESLIEGITPPAIIVNLRSFEEAGQYVVDGGHRTRAILDFMTGEFGIKRNNREYFFTRKPGNDDVSILDDFTRYFIHSKIVIPIQSYHGLTEKDEHVIFQNINKMKCLSKGQCIKAVDTETAHILFGIFQETYEEAQKWITKRASHDWGYTWLETITPVFLKVYCNKGSYQCTKDTSQLLIEVGDMFIQEARDFKTVVSDCIEICASMVVNNLVGISKHLVMKSILLPIFIVIARGYEKEIVIDILAMMHNHHEIWENFNTLEGSCPNSITNVEKKVDLIVYYLD
jgi:hypothetical protein